MSWGSLTLGRIGLNEIHTVPEARNAGTGSRTLRISGREWTDLQKVVPSTYELALARVRALEEDLVLTLHSYLPVTFSTKSDLNGFYYVTDVNVNRTEWRDEAAFIDWDVSLQGVGNDNSTDIESKLGAAIRANDFANTGEIWHAPSPGAYGYWVGSTSPSTMTRTGADGALTIYRALPISQNPTWAVSVGSYLTGRSRLLIDSVERAGEGIRTNSLNWELNNGLLRVRPLSSGGMFEVASYDATSGLWEAKAWHVARGGATVSLGVSESMTVIRNQPERVTIRMLKSHSVGRTYIDLTLRRGARFVEIFVQSSSGATLGIFLNATETATNSLASGYITATGNDADGNRFIAGTARTATYTANQGFSKAAVATLDAFIGSVVGGGSAATGDAAADLMNQYIGSTSETVLMVKR